MRAGWTDVLHALPIAAAVVDQQGCVLEANRWIDVAVGEQLLDSEQALGKGLRMGAEGTSRWRVRPLTTDEDVLLAMAEREDVGDHLLRRFFATSDELFVVYDQAGRIIESNEAWESMLGYSRSDIFGVDSWSLIATKDLVARAAVERDLREQGRSQPTWRMRAADGSYRVVQWTLHFDPTFGRCFGIGRDVSVGHGPTAELHRRVFTDELTGLANRYRLVAELERCISSEQSPSLLFCDLDAFKLINDSLGHHVGDQMLVAVARRLSTVASGIEPLVARFGGDEFAILLPNTSARDAHTIAEKVRETISEPFSLSNRTLHASISVGIACVANDGSATAERLLRHADIAVYEAKKPERGGVVLFDDTLQRAVNRRVNLEAGLRSALIDGDLIAHYQPVMSLDTNQPVGYEALMRWCQGNKLTSAGAFVDVASDSGLMGPIGHVVRADAFAMAAELRQRGSDHWISINVSPPELAMPDFVDQFTNHLATSGAAPEQILVEITESAVLQSSEASSLLSRLRATGVRIGLDDFGTGYSSLAHLRELPIDVVKIDRSFVADVVVDKTTRAVTHSVIELCRALGLDVILEGVETAEQEQVITELGANLVQGWRYSRALSPAAVLWSGAVPDLLASQ